MMKNILFSFLFFAAFTCYPLSVQHQNNPEKEIRLTYYHDRFVGRKTTSGEIFSQQKYTAAHKTLPLHTILEVKNLSNGKKVYVRVNDRCPRHNVLDLSTIAAEKLDMIHAGIVKGSYIILHDSLAHLVDFQDYINFDPAEVEIMDSVMDPVQKIAE